MRFDSSFGSSFGYRRPMVTPAHLVVVGIVAIIGSLLVSAGCSDFTYGRTVEGRIAKDPGHRFKGGTEGSRGEEKIALTLKPVKADSKVEEVAGGPSGVVIECTSTRCAQAAFGECHRFECKYEYRWGQPDVIRCKHEKEIECGENGLAAEAGK